MCSKMRKSVFMLLILMYVCNGTKKISKFVPTEEFQEIEPDQHIPGGLHVRINLTSGKKEAKLLDDVNSESNHALTTISEEEQNENNDQDRLDNMKELVKALKNKTDHFVREKDKMTKSKYRNMNQLKEELADLKYDLQQDTSIASALISKFVLSTSDRDKIRVLKDLEVILHDMDAANDFATYEGASKVIIPGLNSTNGEVRINTMTAIGAAAQSNPVVQVNFMKQDVFMHLIISLSHHTDVREQTRCLYGISSMIRGFPFGQQKFLEIGGLNTLLQLLLDGRSETQLQLKIIKLIRNLLEEKVNAIGERESQLQKIDIASHLVEGGWCPAIASLLRFSIVRDDSSDPHFDMDVLEPLIDVMNYLAPDCKSHFLPFDRKLLNLAAFLKENYLQYGSELGDATDQLLGQIRRKVEL